MAFEVASVKPVGGRFSADFALPVYIMFADKLPYYQMQSMIDHLPKWVATNRYDIQARAAGNPTKDQMRLMVQSLLAERFKLAVHFETQVVPVLAMLLVKPGSTGPKLRPHSEGVPCEATPPTNGSPAQNVDAWPPVCDGYMRVSLPNGMRRDGSRNTTMALLAAALPTFGQPGRPPTPNADAPEAPPGPTFLEALREQLGLKLESTKAPLPILVVDHVERPSEN
jgi:uncharacterized protein (TIGR03435 family)